MAKIAQSVTELIGHTPLLRLCKIEHKFCAQAIITAKVEGFNPGGSAKDRVGYKMIIDAEQKGLLKKGSVIIEPTSGNTGIGLAMTAAVRGYRTILVMPETMSIERRRLLAAYGAEIILTSGMKGMAGAVEKANEIARQMPNSFIPDQFSNASNPQAHYETTGPEIWEDTDGKVDIYVATIGTGGTLSGAAKYLKEKNPSIRVVGVEPEGSPLLTKGYAGSHQIQGIGANFIPETLNRNIYDEIVTVSDSNAFLAGREVARIEGLLIGISGGAAVWAAIELAKRPENKGKTIVTVLPDTGERYLSTAMFE